LRQRPRLGETAELGVLGLGVRLGALIGPMVLGVSAGGVALPSAAVALRVSPEASSWVLAAYSLAVGVGMALFGRLCDARGVRGSLLAGTLLLGVGALACVGAPDVGVLVAGRLALGAGAGAVSASALALGASLEPARRTRVLATVGATMSIFASTATLVGGVVTAALSWRVAMALPALSLVGVCLCLRQVAAPVAQSRTPIDVVGAGLLTVTVAALLLLIQARTLRLPAPLVGAAALLATLGALGLARSVSRRPTGLVPQVLAGDRAFHVDCAIGFGMFGGYFAALYAVPQILVHDHGWSVLAVGVALMPGAVLGAAISRAIGHVAASLGTNRLLAATAAMFTAALVGAGTAGVAAGFVVAVSVGFTAFGTLVALVDRVSARTPAAHRGAAAGLLNLAFLVGGSVGSSAAGALSPSLGFAHALLVVAALPLAAGLIAASRPRHEWRPKDDSMARSAVLATRRSRQGRGRMMKNTERGGLT